MRIAHIYLIVQVETTVACITDGEVTDQLHEEVAKANLRPAVHLLDSGYVDSHVLCRAQEQHGIRVVGPVAVESRWQGL